MKRRLFAFLGVAPFGALAQSRVANVQLEVKIPQFENFSITPSGGQTFTLPKDYSFIQLFLNGIFQTPGYDYNRAGLSITFSYITPGPEHKISGLGVL